MIRALLVAVAVTMLGGVSSAWALGKGSTLFAIELTGGTADLSDYSAGPTGYLRAYRVPEVGFQAQYWSLSSADYALTLSGGAAFSKESYKPASFAPAGSGDVTLATTSYNVRLGGDRVIQVGPRTVMYGGPGVEYWRLGKSRLGGVDLKRIGLSARLGATMMIGPSSGVTAHFGQRIGYAKARASGEAEATWWPSSFEGAMGFVLVFRGKP